MSLKERIINIFVEGSVPSRKNPEGGADSSSLEIDGGNSPESIQYGQTKFYSRLEKTARMKNLEIGNKDEI